jgi:hypothetical protein
MMEQKTGKDFLSQEAIEVAAEWWTNSLRKLPNKDYGDKSKAAETTMLMALVNAAENLSSEAKLADFKAALVEAIQHEQVWGEYLTVNTDYFPEGCLADAAKIAGISELSFSMKTWMHIYPNEVHLMAGINSDWETIWERGNG